MDDRATGWIHLYRKMLDATSSFSSLSLAQRAVFIGYLLAARYTHPHLGCLCSSDGKPWSSREKARRLSCSRHAISNAEAAMLDAGLITIRANGIIHITNYNIYQSKSGPVGTSSLLSGGPAGTGSGPVGTSSTSTEGGPAGTGTPPQPFDSKQNANSVSEKKAALARAPRSKKVRNTSTATRAGGKIIDFNSSIPASVQADTGRPYDAMQVREVLESALPENVWRELASSWSQRLVIILNADTETLSLTDIYHLLQKYPPTLDQRWPEGWLRQARFQQKAPRDYQDDMHEYWDKKDREEREDNE